jgi:hypothetical protein
VHLTIRKEWCKLKKRSLEAFMETKKQTQYSDLHLTRAGDVQQYPTENIGFVGDSQDNRAMLASINAYKQAIEKALGEKQ